MNDNIPTFLYGMSFGIILFGLFLQLPSTYHSKAQKAIEECEKTLPRNQHCQISATPEQTPWLSRGIRYNDLVVEKTETKMDKKNEFLKELKNLLEKYDVSIAFNVGDTCDLHGFYDERVTINHQSAKDSLIEEEWLCVDGWSFGSSDIEIIE